MYVSCVSILNYTNKWIHSCSTCSVMHIVRLFINEHKPEPLKKQFHPASISSPFPPKLQLFCSLLGFLLIIHAGYNLLQYTVFLSPVSEELCYRTSPGCFSIEIWSLHVLLLHQVIIKCQIQTMSEFIRENNVRTLYDEEIKKFLYIIQPHALPAVWSNLHCRICSYLLQRERILKLYLLNQVYFVVWPMTQFCDTDSLMKMYHL